MEATLIRGENYHAAATAVIYKDGAVANIATFQSIRQRLDQ